jgi:hypothetical protein
MFSQEKPIFSYSQNQAIEDGFLINNPIKDIFTECNIITPTLFNQINKIQLERNLKRIFPYEPNELLKGVMKFAKKIFDNKNYVDDHDKDFFAIPPNEENVTIWFVRNETNKLTAMLPSDY